MKKKILFILPSFNFGGTVVSTLNMIIMLQDQYDISVFAMTHDGPIKEQYHNIRVLSEYKVLSLVFTRYEKFKNPLDKLLCLFIRGIQRILRMVGVDLDAILCKHSARKIWKREQFDIVASCQEGYSTTMASFFEKATRIAWFRTEYSIFKDMVSAKHRSGHHEVYSKFDNIVCVSKTTRDDFVAYFPDLEQKAIAIHNIQKTEHIINMSKEHVDDMFEKDVFTIVSVGRFAKQKRFSFIPEIASKVKATGAKFKWFIIGDGNDAGEYDETTVNLQQFNVKDCVECIGSRKNPYPYIANADLMVLPSYYEACPRVVIESKILHTPVVCADFSSAREFVTNDVDGYVDDINKLDVYISKLIQDTHTYERINNTCNEFLFDNEGIQRQLYELF